MWPQVKQFDSYERVPFESFEGRPEWPEAVRQRRRSARVLTCGAVLVALLASASYVLAADAARSHTPSGACPLDSSTLAGTPSRVLCDLLPTVADAPGARFHIWA